MSDWHQGTCPRHEQCSFYQSVVISPLMRIKYASMRPYCKLGKHASCSRWWLMERGQTVPDGLLPDGGTDVFEQQVRRGSSASHGRILVVDDLPLFRKSLVTLVNNASGGGYTIVEAESGEQALEKLLEDTTQWTLVVTDYNMGGMSGYDLIVRLRAHPALASLPAIVFSSEQERSVQDRVMALPRVRWLEKKPGQDLFDGAWRELIAERKA